MEELYINVLNEELFVIIQESLITSLYKKDILNNTNNYVQERIIYCLQKLNYYNIDTINETKEYLINHLNNIINNELNFNWESQVKNKRINEILNYIRGSSEFSMFMNKQNYRINRAFVLSKFLNNIESTKTFYENLTLEELKILNN